MKMIDLLSLLIIVSLTPGISTEEFITVERCIEEKLRDLTDEVVPDYGGHLSSGLGAEYIFDKDYSTELQNNYHCTCTKAQEEINPWWMVDLESPMIIDYTALSTPIGHARQDWTVLIGDTSPDDIRTYDFDVTREKKCLRAPDSSSKYICGGQKGRYLSIIGDKNRSLSICEVIILAMPFPIKNLAESKPTNQISTSYKADSNLAVDGYRVPGGLFYNNWKDLVPQCTHTNDNGEEFPWWTVDLEKDYIVYEVDLYNRGEGLQSRLHDFEIRIGSYDISAVNKSSHRFRRNPVCASYVNRIINDYEKIECLNPLFGRHVSVQIIKKCEFDGCHWSAREKNVLTLCEVEVYGIEVATSEQKSNVANYSELEWFIRYVHENEPHITLKYPWMQVQWDFPVVVNEISIEIEAEGPVPDFEVRIGKFPITSIYSYEHFKLNTLCARVKNGKLSYGINELECFQPLFGRYATLQVTEPCDNHQCLLELHNLLAVVKINAWSDTKILMDASVVVNKTTYQSSTFKNGYSNLALDGEDQWSLFTPNSFAYCAKTKPEKNPWWTVKIRPIHLIEEVVVYLPGNGTNTLFRDFEILVTNESIANLLRDPDFKSTPSMVCATSEDKVYPEGKNKFPCHVPIFDGRFISIRIANDKRDNVLSICEVEVFGCISPFETDITLVSVENDIQRPGFDEFDYEAFD